MISKDGYSVILYTGLFTVLLLICSLLTGWIGLWVVTALGIIVFVFHFFFFRDPERDTPQTEKGIVAPADGKIIRIDEVDEPLFFKGRAKRISIFMSVFNVHVNRIPVSGQVTFFQYKKGSFLAAFNERACEHNEQTAIGIEGPAGKLMFKQIAGLIARRIVCRVNRGDQVAAGDRLGMIKYSSRVDLFLPMSSKVLVQLRQSVKCGETIIGEFSE